MISTLAVARVQFALTITFHIIFPSLSIGLATYIVIVEGLWLKTARAHYYQSCRFWSKVLALTFGMGIISGLAMEFQMGTNWGEFAKIVGPVLGVLFVSEALTAFFIEATFLGFMLLGWGRINRYFHFLCSCMVWLGVMLSAFWIIAANSWMQTPAGVTYTHHQFIVTSWWQVIFNPSTLIRYLHMILASYIMTLMVIGAVACYYLLQQRFHAFACFTLKFVIIALTIILPLQVFIGDEVGIKVHEHQPIKTAAIEGLWHTTRGAPLLLLADIDQTQQKNHFSIAIPHLASVINTHQWNGKLAGLTSVVKQQQPNVMIVFYSFRIMVGLGILLLMYAGLGLFKLLRNSLYSSRWFLRAGVLLAPSGLLALLTGWYTSETGRQPWVVYHLLSTLNGVSVVPINKVMIGFLLIILIYGILFGYFYNLYFIKIVRHGPSYYGAQPTPKKLLQLRKKPC